MMRRKIMKMAAADGTSLTLSLYLPSVSSEYLLGCGARALAKCTRHDLNEKTAEIHLSFPPDCPLFL